MAELWRDRYEPLEVVGQGGQGSVVRALDHLHHRHVALKIRPLGAPEEREALLGEARVLLELEPHPLVTLARDDFFLDERYVLVMDWVAGTSLAERVAAAGGGLPLADVVGWLGQVAEALDHLHRHEPPVVHSDVKPANIVVTPEGKAVLVDFGIARRRPGDRPVLAGSAHFVAPEVAAGEPPTPAADVFSLAATAFVLLTGRPPRPGERPDWAAMAGDRAGEVELVLRRGLAVDPARRPPSAGDFLAALRGTGETPRNLPAALTSFVGREAEVARVAARLRGVRLLTLTGAGGLGKTRLAMEVAGEVLAAYPDGVFLVELAPLNDPALVPQQILAALGVMETEPEAPEPPSADGMPHRRPAMIRPPARLVAELAARRALLVLDNCEHLVDACATVAEALLQACPHLRVLATSREPLRVPGEVTWRVEPLSTPDLDRLPPVESLGRYEAVRLFVERAAAVSPGFELSPANAAPVASVCARLEGIPLALELAAARTTVLPVEQIARRLDDRFRLLAGGSRTSPGRHQSLRAAIDWTHDALAPAEQALFRRLSVFSGGFTLEAAEAVCAEEDVFEVLAGLVDKSLVVADAGRYRLLETLRQYGAQKLSAAGESEDLDRRHLGWALALAERGDLASLEAEHDNLRAALATAAASPGPVLPRLVAALGPFWRARGYLEEGRSWVEAALAKGVADEPPLRGAVLAAGAPLALLQGDFDTARRWSEERLERAEAPGEVEDARHELARVASWQGDDALARSLHEANLEARRQDGDRLGLAETLLGLAGVLPPEVVVYESRELVAEAVAILRTLEAPAALARALTMWGQRAHGVDPAAAREALEEAVAILEGLGDRLALADALAALANLEQTEADFAAADPIFDRVLAIRREAGNRAGLARALIQVGQQTKIKGDYAGARRLYDEALSLSRQLGETHGEANALDMLALLDMFEGDYSSARPKLERALGLLRELGDLTCELAVLMSLGDAAWGVGDVSEARSTYRECVARAGAVGRKPRVMYCVERLGSAGAMGDFERAAKLLGAAQGMRDRLRTRRPLYSVPEWEDDVATARAGLGDEAFEAAWAEGYTMAFEELVRYAVSEPVAAASVLAHPGGGGSPAAGHGPAGAERSGTEQAH